MRNSCLQQSPPAAASAGALIFQAGVAAKLVAHFRPLGSPLQHSGSAGRAVVAVRPGLTPFPGGRQQHGVASAASQFWLWRHSEAQLPTKLSFPPSGRTAGSVHEARGERGLARRRRPGARGRAHVAGRPAPRPGPAARRLSGAGPGSPRGDRAPERALCAALATLRTSFQPPTSPHSKPPRRPCLFTQARALHPDTPAALGAASAARGRGPRPTRRRRPAGSGARGPFRGAEAWVGRTGCALMGRTASAGGEGPSPVLRSALAACAAAHPTAPWPRPGPQPGRRVATVRSYPRTL